MRSEKLRDQIIDMQDELIGVLEDALEFDPCEWCGEGTTREETKIRHLQDCRLMLVLTKARAKKRGKNERNG